MSNHLIIGLGGTGGKIIRSFRKTIFQEFRKIDPDDVYINYLYIDSSTTLMGPDDSTWKVLGQSVELPLKNKLIIEGEGLSDTLNSITNFPGIKPWIGDKDIWNSILSDLTGSHYGSQKRRLGRFLFACKIDDFNERLSTITRTLQKSSSQSNITFHICTGLAGGTGSGIVIDVVAQIRKKFDSQNRIILYTLIPEKIPNPKWDTGNYCANGYAALMELNSFSVGHYKPVDLSDGKELSSDIPFNGCYVFTNDNENGLIVDIDIQLPDIVADFLYQKIVVANDLPEWDQILRMENAENYDGGPEVSSDNSKIAIPERSKRFLTFGIKRISIPEEEIREYLTYNFAEQCILQLLYNNWSDNEGYMDNPKNQDIDSYVMDIGLQEKYKITDDHFILSYGILLNDINDKTWKNIDSEWHDFINNCIDTLEMIDTDKKKWLIDLFSNCTQRFNERYRKLGVKLFYASKTKAKKSHAKEIRSVIENDLFSSWLDGTKSLHEIDEIVSKIITNLKERNPKFHRSLSDINGKVKKAQIRIDNNKLSWDRIGKIKSFFGVHKRRMRSHTKDIEGLFINQTLVEGWKFEAILLTETINELTDLIAVIKSINSKIKEARKKVGDAIADRILDNELIDSKSYIIKLFNPQKVKDTTKKLIKNKQTQEISCSALRRSLSEIIGTESGFSNFDRKMGSTLFIDTIEKMSLENSLVAHNLSNDKLLGENIVANLKQQHEINPTELSNLIIGWTEKAGNFAEFNNFEKRYKGKGIDPKEAICTSNFNIILPSDSDHSVFVQQLKKLFEDAKPGDSETIETSNEKRKNEITLINITNLIPLRCLKRVRDLKDKYKSRLEDNNINKKRIEIEVHTAGKSDTFFDLFPSDPEVEDYLPFLILAKVIGLVQSTKDEFGNPKIAIILKDEYGLSEDPIILGDTIRDSLKSFDPEYFPKIKEVVTNLLRSREFGNNIKKKELINGISTIINEIEKEVGNDIYHDDYKKFRKSGLQAIEILNSERLS